MRRDVACGWFCWRRCAARCCQRRAWRRACSLSHAEIWLRGDGRTSRLYAENAGDTTLYLDVEQRLLRNPGEQPEELTPIGEVRNPTLLVAPVRLALAPGQRAPITLKELARPESPQVWRVTFRPREKLLVANDPAPWPRRWW